MNGLSLGLVGCLLAFGGFFVGRWSAPSTSLEVSASKNPHIRLVQTQVPEFGLPNQPSQQAQPTQPNTPALPGQQVPNDPRELIPLGRGNGQQPGQGQQPQPGQGQQNCPVYIYQDGQLFQFPQPGQQPGQQPGNGQGQGPGFGGPQELIPLSPGPGSPAPQTPNQTLPTRPRANSNDNRS